MPNQANQIYDIQTVRYVFKNFFLFFKEEEDLFEERKKAAYAITLLIDFDIRSLARKPVYFFAFTAYENRTERLN